MQLTLKRLEELSAAAVSALDYTALTEPTTITRLISELEQAYPGYGYDLLAVPDKRGHVRKRKQTPVPVPVLKFALYWGNALIKAGMLDYARAEYRRVLSN